MNNYRYRIYFFLLAYFFAPILSLAEDSSTKQASDAERECREMGEQAARQVCYGNPGCAMANNEKTLSSCRRWLEEIKAPLLQSQPLQAPPSVLPPNANFMDRK